MAEEQNKNTEVQTGESNENNTSENYGDFEKGFSKGFAKAKESAENKLLQDLGVESVDVIKSLMAEKQKADEASKTELEKAQSVLSDLQSKNEQLLKEIEQIRFDSTINSLAAKNGITELDYFKMEYSKNSSNEDFKVDEFINNLRESKPFVFGQIEKKTVQTDNSSNSKDVPSTFSQRVKNAKTKKELDALYSELYK